VTEGNGLRLRLALLVAAVSGGTARHVAALADGCSRAGLAVSGYGPPSTRRLFGPAAAFTPVNITDRPRPARDVVALARLRRALRAARPDVVHAHGVRAGAFAALALAGWRGQGRRQQGRRQQGRRQQGRRPALAVTVHNGPPAGRLNRAVYAALERVCARRADAVLCASADLVARMRAAGAAGAEQFDVPAGPPEPPSPAAVARAAADIGANGRPVVLAVGRLAPQKGFDVLVAAATRWASRDPAPRTVIAGSGPLAAQLADQARRSGADVLLLGERDDVPALLAQADVFVLPSRWEARALTLQEAMRAGRPVVATAAGGTPDVTGKDAALLVPPGDAGALALAVLAVLDDAGLAASLSRAGQARAAAFPTEQDAVRQAGALYRRLAAARPGR
jgi:glycosyltransferase involved in cell wall biosynthesis